MTELIELKDLPRKCPEWPFSPWSTGNMIRLKQLRCVRVGKRVFVTYRILEEFIKANTEDPL
jgi:hypothetical protein